MSSHRPITHTHKKCSDQLCDPECACLFVCLFVFSNSFCAKRFQPVTAMRSTGHSLTNIEEERVFWPISVNNESTKRQNNNLFFCFFVKVYLVRTDHSALFSIVCFRGGYLVWSILLYMISGVPDWQWRLKTITIYGWWTFTDWDAASCFEGERRLLLLLWKDLIIAAPWLLRPDALPPVHSPDAYL